MISARPQPGIRIRSIQIALIVAGSALMALGAHISLVVPFSPVPVSGQTFALALVVALLGTRGAVFAMGAYLAEGAAGLPVFSPYGGPGGWLAFVGPTAGFLLAFPVAAFVTGWLFDRGLWNSYAGRALGIGAGTLVVFAGGAAWLAASLGPSAALAVGVTPFLLGDAVKTLIAAAVAPALRTGSRLIPVGNPEHHRARSSRR